MKIFNKLKTYYKLGKLKLWSDYSQTLRKEHQLRYLFWECTLKCNFFCQHCGSSCLLKDYKDELTTEQIKRTLKNIADNFNAKKIMLAVTGGEPLLRSDIFEVMQYASDLGFNWGMVTNGFLLDNNIVEKMKKTKMQSVVVSIDGIGATHDNLRNKEGAYDQAIKAVKLLTKANFLKSLQITSTISSKNFHELEKMYQTFLPLGITSWRAMNVDPIGRADENKNLLLSGQQLRELLEFLKQKRGQSKIDITFGCSGFLGPKFEGEVRADFFNCYTGINVGSILYNGDIFVCPNVPRKPELIQGNVNKDDFSEVWKNKFEIFRNKNRTSCASCQKCEWWDNCLGGSYHLWNFEKNEPKICFIKEIAD